MKINPNVFLSRFKSLSSLSALSAAIAIIFGGYPINVWARSNQNSLPIKAISISSKPDRVSINSNNEVKNMVYETHDLVLNVNTLEYPIEDLHIVVEKEREILIELSADVLFDFDKANLKPSAVAALESVANRIRETSRGDVRIEGHTDSKGSNEYNQTLSEKRAISVRNWFVSEGGLSNVKFATKGLGELKPVVSNTTEEGADDPIGRQRNRRVEIIIKTGN
ncbi:OmpA family protein [Prochlorococcus marinus]|uniref:OmpA family protein n=1 Tax=Prochlorococcus marinus TaxID=1219 RepID=UPI000AE5DD7A|nr:OmpA family protein [Prochlorococcus marinus]